MISDMVFSESAWSFAEIIFFQEPHGLCIVLTSDISLVSNSTYLMSTGIVNGNLTHLGKML